ncbi:MAG: amino acid ABC transporter substrate-binding protein [Burkholderiales bacterium]
MTISRRAVLASTVLFLFGTAASAQAPSGAPIRIGSSIAITGPLGATGLIHKLVGEIYVEDLNKRGGLLGRPVEWSMKDDQSRPDVTRTLYEQIITVDKVDLLMGPYATGAILAAMGVAQRYNRMLIHATMGLPHLAKYEGQFPVSGIPANPDTAFPHTVFGAVSQSAKPPKTIAIVASKFPSTQFISSGARQIAQKYGIKELLYLEWEFGNRDFGPIAARIKDAKPDFLWAGVLGLEGNLLIDAMKKIDYAPPNQFFLFPAPGPLAKSPDGKNAMSLSTFEEHAPFTSVPGAAAFIKTFNERAAKAGLPDNTVELQASVAYSAWQTLEAAVKGANSLDDKALIAWLKKSRVKTIIGEQRFDGPFNHSLESSYRLKQVQDGKWKIVWPREFAAPGAKLIMQ